MGAVVGQVRRLMAAVGPQARAPVDLVGSLARRAAAPVVAQAPRPMPAAAGQVRRLMAAVGPQARAPVDLVVPLPHWVAHQVVSRPRATDSLVGQAHRAAIPRL
ncbi:MAG: hypothetical protein ACJ8R9_32785 [Steroidobacteraceae bacterium]